MSSLSYLNPLHRSVSPFQSSNYSALGTAVSVSCKQPTFESRNAWQREMVPQTTFVPSLRSKHGQEKPGPLCRPITFNFIGLPNHGMPIREMCARGPHALQYMMQGANDLVLAGLETEKITFHIRWPGYEHIEWIRSIEVMTPHGPMTRSQLAVIVAQNFARFIEKSQYEATTDIKWRLGPGGVQFEHILLVSMYNVFECVWQAEVVVDFR
ncbi:hypothetical protein E1B28_005351 [Marasmius oreades]|uniref:Uncharacterized protein n=1 Tax=Marasmius oreades TaxID=181124 RepID=A0A9P7UUP6_9AGAR|nr:uncharacterized protein E1B28_005351 [Marasmius oreades]KAG7094520.1 hypothetical protein E1B28_005351 [Marasmius oreades]